MARKHTHRHAHADKRMLILRAACLFCLLLVVFGGIWAVGQRLESRDDGQQVRGDVRERLDEEEIVEYDGVEYRRRNRQTAILFMGIDRRNDQELSESSFRNGGQADFLLLLLVDNDAKRVTPIQIDRDTMAEITILGVLGNPAGTREAQICLSHGFGDGREQSCLLAADAVSKLLLGVDIDYYMAMNMDGISVLNDFLGGITVTLEDDFSELDPEMTQGATLKLMGDQAEYYVRNRMNVGIGTNEARMARQRAYMMAAGEILEGRLRENANYAGDLYDELEKYLITDIKRGRMINLAANCAKYEREETVFLDGDHAVGADGFMEFHPDEDALVRMVIDRFYEPIS